MSFQINCNSVAGNTGLPECYGNYGRIISFVLVPKGQEIADAATAETLATWTAGFENGAATRWYSLPDFFMYDPAREDTVYEQGHYNTKFFVREGYASGKAMYLDLDICFIKKLRQLNGKTWYGYAVTENGYILGTSSDGTKFEPFEMFVNVEAEKPGTADEKRKTPVEIYAKNDYEWSDKGVAIFPVELTTNAWNPRNEFYGLLDVDVTIVSSSATSVVCDVKTTCGGIGVPDLVKTDFLLQDDTPSTESIVTATESTTIPGRYTLDVTTLGADDYTLNLAEPAAMTTAGYDPGDDASFTVS